MAVLRRFDMFSVKTIELAVTAIVDGRCFETDMRRVCEKFARALLTKRFEKLENILETYHLVITTWRK